MSLPSPLTTSALTVLNIPRDHGASQTLDVDEERPAAAAWQAPFGIAAWIFLSNLTILLNKWLMDTAGFRYPILLACWHFVFTTVAIHALARCTSLLDSRHDLGVTPRLYLRTIIPIGVCFSASLICSNVVYLYLSVAFIQMLNAANPVAVLLVSWVWRVADPSTSTLINMLLIVAGAAIASAGEIQFSVTGLLFQVGGIVFGAVRLVMIQVLVSRKGMKMNPLVGLYYFSPACAAMTFLAALYIELPRFETAAMTKAGIGLLVLNALVAFLLNATAVYLVGRTSGLVMALTGIFKNILLIVASVMIWDTKITVLQGAGYSLALAGLMYHWIGGDQLAKGYRLVGRRMMDSLQPGRGRRALLVALGASGLCVLLFTYRHLSGV